MYGLVNLSIEQMVLAAHGEDAWERIKSRAGIEELGFVSNEPYPDDITYRLVDAASRELQAEPAEILRAFGEFWVLHTAVQAYGPMMRAAGRSLKEFLTNLPHLHTRVEMIYPSLRPPEFSCEDDGASCVVLHYRSSRPAGLEPFVEGILYGLGKMYGTEVQVELVQLRGAEHGHSVFRVRMAEGV